MNLSLYRKYRPKTFDDVEGQEHIKKYFKNAIEKNELSHAYIFTGPRGTGKTTIARILAKVVNCKTPINYNPCNQCENCKAADTGSFMDFIELDAASNRGIDEIRSIRDSANYRPAYGKYKFYIIDEFHMLTREAFNALLKTLEEPPEHVIFVLATTNLEKVPETIISRSQLLNFKNISKYDILQRIKHVCKNEDVEYDDDAIEIIAEKANGGLRDALSLLEQVIKFSGARITKNDAMNVLGLFDDNFVFDFIEAMYLGNINDILKISDKLFSTGKEPEVLLEQAIEKIFKRVKEGEVKSKLIFILNKLNQLLKDIKFNENKRMIFDINILEITYSLSNKKNTEIIDLDEPVESSLKDLEFDVAIKSDKVSIENLYAQLLKILSEDRSKYNLAMYFALSNSELKISTGVAEFRFNEERLLEYQLMKNKYFSELNVLVSLTAQDPLQVKLLYQGDLNKKAVETDESHNDINSMKMF